MPGRSREKNQRNPGFSETKNPESLRMKIRKFKKSRFLSMYSFSGFLIELKNQKSRDQIPDNKILRIRNPGKIQI